MQVSLNTIAASIIQPLQYYFSIYGSGANLFWSSNIAERTIDIFEAYDDNKTILGQKPRIIVTRGSFQISKTGLNDNLAEAPSIRASRGEINNINMVLYQGAAGITIEARMKGTCELIADMVSHFIVWTRPLLCNTGGWKEFGLPLQVADAVLLNDEDPSVPKFQVQMQVPWIKEEHWQVQTQNVELKRIIQNIYVPTP